MNREQERIFDEATSWARSFGFKEGMVYGFLVFGSSGCLLGIWLGQVLK